MNLYPLHSEKSKVMENTVLPSSERNLYLYLYFICKYFSS